MRLDEVKKVTVSCIYRITFPDGKYYVGQTKNLRERVNLYERNVRDVSCNSRLILAIRSAGIENLVWDVLADVSVRDSEDLRLCLSILEIKYIRECDCISPKGYNVSIGGELLGIPADFIETKFGVTSSGFGCKAVLVYDADGNFVSEHPSLSHCAYALGVDVNRVKGVLDKISLLRNTYMIREKRYGEVPKRIMPFKPKVVTKHRIQTKYNTVYEKVYKRKEMDNAVIMYDKEGEFVGVFDSAYQIRKRLRVDFAFKFGREFHGYYMFHYFGGEIKRSIGAFTSKKLLTTLYDDILSLGDTTDIGRKISIPQANKESHRKIKNPVVMERKQKPKINKFTLDGKFICSYDSLVEAAEKNDVLVSGVYACAHKTLRRCGDFIYRYEGDTLDLPKFSKSTMDARLQRSLEFDD